MKMRIFLWSFVLLALSLCGAYILYWQSIPERLDVISQEEVAQEAKRLGIKLEEPVQQVALAPIDMNRSVRLAIGNLGLGDEDQNLRLGDLILTELTDAKGLDLVDRQALERVLLEMDMSFSGLVRAKDAVRVGKLLKADWFLLGSESTINGNVSILVRVVDARTGIFREAGVFSGNEPAIDLSKKIADFVRQCRQDAATAKPRAYLALGTFHDLSVNNRQAAFPTQLRSYLMTAFQGGNTTLLEREHVHTLFREMRLDLAGLTQEGATNTPSPMQSALWLVDGYYQSYETTTFQVELVLNVNRMFGQQIQEIFRGLPNEAFFERIKNQIDMSMKQILLDTRRSRLNEVHAQTLAGLRLARLTRADLLIFSEGYQDFDQQERAKRHRNVDEAIRAFETVLVLDPENSEAKLGLAACLRKQFIGRTDEARDLYCEILESPVQDKWTKLAQQALIFSFERENDEETAKWFERVAQQTTNSFAAEYYRQKALDPKKPGAIYTFKLPEEDELEAEPLLITHYTRNSSKRPYTEKPGAEGKISQAFAYLENKNWQQALEVFETFTNMPVLMSSTGPWGRGWLPVLPSKEVAYCRAKLGLPETRNPREFDMGKPLFCFCTPSTFITDINGLWIGINGQLMHLDFDLKTNLVVNLPMDDSTPITALCLTSSNIWIGTGGEGLIEFDKFNRQCRRLTVKDGLMMDAISYLKLAEDVLWIGFGYKDEPGRSSSKSTKGGLGQLNLASRRHISFTPSLGMAMGEVPNQPPRQPVTDLVAKSDQEAWFLADSASGGVHHYLRKDNIWETIPQVHGGDCLAIDAEHVYSGQFWGFSGGSRTGPLGLDIFSFRDRQWRSFKPIDGLTSAALSALTLDDKYLWVGGMGYMALLDPKMNQVLKLAYIRARHVDKIQIGGGYVWAQFDWHLYRAPLADIYPK